MALPSPSGCGLPFTSRTVWDCARMPTDFGDGPLTHGCRSSPTGGPHTSPPGSMRGNAPASAAIGTSTCCVSPHVDPGLPVDGHDAARATAERCSSGPSVMRLPTRNRGSRYDEIGRGNTGAGGSPSRCVAVFAFRSVVSVAESCVNPRSGRTHIADERSEWHRTVRGLTYPVSANVIDASAARTALTSCCGVLAPATWILALDAE